MNSDQRRRIIASTKFGQPHKATTIEQLFSRLEDAINSTTTTITPILLAGGGHDKPALRETVFRVLMENLDSLEHEEMHIILTTIIADRIMVDVDSNPSGNSTPDLLGGK